MVFCPVDEPDYIDCYRPDPSTCRLCEPPDGHPIIVQPLQREYLSRYRTSLGHEFLDPQTGKMGDGWAYVYTADKIRGFKQTHQPSPWMNDYGQFAIMPVTGSLVFDQNKRASWFSHKAETVSPDYYSVYLADYDVTTEITATERAAQFRFTFPKSDSSFLVIDAFDKGSYVKILPNEKESSVILPKTVGEYPLILRTTLCSSSINPSR